MLTRLRQDLHELEFEPLGESSGRFCAADSRIGFVVEEVVQKHFLMRVVTARFIFRIPGSATGTQHLTLRHTGKWKRTGIQCIPPDARISADAELARALLPLDFTRCELIQDEQGWQCRLEHYGASEVIGRFPPVRRYVRLTHEQQVSMLAAFAALRRLLG